MPVKVVDIITLQMWILQQCLSKLLIYHTANVDFTSQKSSNETITPQKSGFYNTKQETCQTSRQILSKLLMYHTANVDFTTIPVKQVDNKWILHRKSPAMKPSDRIKVDFTTILVDIEWILQHHTVKLLDFTTQKSSNETITPLMWILHRKSRAMKPLHRKKVDFTTQNKKPVKLVDKSCQSC
mmetsp:Transcript_17535/g.27437  ORF Transcript_17535/g.27437 Transcript_17535/m.27437 type:complete len:183 (+) Transcript_17535:80-628(+)